MSRLLQAAHLQPILYPSAEAFLMDTKRPKFACLVLDLQLKGMSRLELSRRLYAVKDAAPVVFITAHDDPEVRAQGFMTFTTGHFLLSSAFVQIRSFFTGQVQGGF
jgi:FixJ family two-component response regulator